MDAGMVVLDTASLVIIVGVPANVYVTKIVVFTISIILMRSFNMKEKMSNEKFL
tara:strand:+ start:133 stop:294 length:162 start_codon:yes stop_codon:yes gene_type:complete